MGGEALVRITLLEREGGDGDRSLVTFGIREFGVEGREAVFKLLGVDGREAVDPGVDGRGAMAPGAGFAATAGKVDFRGALAAVAAGASVCATAGGLGGVRSWLSF